MLERKVGLTGILSLAVFVFLPFSGRTQQVQHHSKNSKISIRFIVSAPTRFNLRSNNSYNQLARYGRSVSKELFTGNYFWGLAADYFFKKHLTFSPAVYFTHGQTHKKTWIEFYSAPPQGTIQFFKNHYTFFSFFAEPKLKFLLPYHKIDFFWKFGPIFSYASLSSRTKGAPNNDPHKYLPYSHSNSHIFGFGVYIATGVQYAFIRHAAISLQLGYQYVHYPDFTLSNTIARNYTESYRYSLNAITPRAGISYRL